MNLLEKTDLTKPEESLESNARVPIRLERSILSQYSEEFIFPRVLTGLRVVIKSQNSFGGGKKPKLTTKRGVA